MGSEVFARIYAVLARVPAGRVVTYGQIAMAVGLPRGARTVGWALRHCPEGLPWHRVVNAHGAISGGCHANHAALHRSLLEDEGIVFDANGYIDLRIYGWDEI
ncbi:MAG TPA: cysteine methyltransferase [Chloroflexi bacterium]|jgi:methylated-DNA-protein-cysteine methyltransferase-like protein|nr:cysteine methyltransferase [Chloroflexota bacterium]